MNLLKTKIKSSIRQIILIITVATSLLCVSCSSPQLIFSDNNWGIDANGHITTSNSKYNFTFEAAMIYPSMPIISNLDSVSKYPTVDKYLASICRELPFVVDSILFYTPTMNTLYVTYSDFEKPAKPHSITCNIKSVEDYYTMWIKDDDDEKNRKSDEIYSNTAVNKTTKRILVIDRFTYKDENVARISIFQTSTKKLDKMQLPKWAFHWANINDPNRLEIISNFVDGHRKVTVANYLKGK